MNKYALIAVCLMASSSSLVAQESLGNEGTWEFSGRLGTLGIDSETALAQGIDDSGFILGMTADYIQNGWVTSLGGDYIGYDDNASFRQEVEGSGLFNNGDISVAKSDASAVSLFVASGYQWLLGEQQQAAALVQLGITGVFASERGIDSCTDCYSEDIDVDGGVFIQTSLKQDVGSFSIGVYYQHYLTGDGLTNSAGLLISSGF